MPARQRRRFLLAGVGGAGMALWCAGPGRFGAGAFAQAAVGPFEETELRGGLLQLEGAGGNIVLLGGSSGVAMVDSGAPEHEKNVMSYVAERFGGASLEILFNTHWHLGHTGGNEAAGRSGARIVAHENTRLWMSTDFYVDWQDRTYGPRPPAARPTDTFFSSDPQPIEVDFDGGKLEYGHLREAHTDGDIYVRFLEHNVIVAGGAVAVGRYPVLDYMTGGLIGGLIDSTQKLIDMCDADTLIVPGRGSAQKRAHLEAQRDMLSTLLERVETMARQGKSVDEMLAAGVTDDFDAHWGNNAERFLSNVYNGLWGIGR